MSTTQNLLTIKVHIDDDTGMYQVGELDYGVSMFAKNWVQEKTHGQCNRESLVNWLEHLADACKNNRPPFGDNHPASMDYSHQMKLNQNT